MSVWFAALALQFAAAPKPSITAIAFTPDGNAVIVGSQAGLEIRSWPELNVTGELSTELTNVHDLVFSPDGTFLAATGGEPAERGTVELFDWPAGKLRVRFHPHQDLIYAVAWRMDSAALATAGADHKVALLAIPTGKSLRLLEGHSRSVLAVTFLSHNAGLLSAGVDETLRLWDVESGESRGTFTNHTRPVNQLAIRPLTNSESPPFVASASDDRTVRLWQPTIGRMVRFARLESSPLSIAWSVDGKRLFAACKDGHVRTIDPDTAEALNDQPAVDGVAYCLAVATDGNLLVGGSNGQLRRIEPSKN